MTSSPTLVYSADDIANMNVSEQQTIVSQLSPKDQQLVMQAIRNKVSSNNINFMRNSQKQYVSCPVNGTSAVSATYTLGQTLNFDLPTVAGGYALGILIKLNLTVNPATGTAAVYGKTAAAQYAAIQYIDVMYNGPQIHSCPYIEAKMSSVLKGRGQTINNEAMNMSGNFSVTSLYDNSDIQSFLNNNCAITVNTNNSWSVYMYVPFNKLGPEDPKGLIPLNTVGTRGKVELTLPSAFLGFDPLRNVIYANGGTGHDVTVTGTVAVDCLTINGTNLASPINLLMDLNNEATVQTYWDSPLAPLQASLLNKKQLSLLMKHWNVTAIVIDGVQSDKFSTISNIQQIALAPDSTSNNNMFHYGVSDNLTMYDFYELVRKEFGQDMDPGVIPIVAGTTRGVNDPNNRNGTQFLNMKSGGYPAATFGCQVGAVASTNIVPRIEFFYWSENADGLKRV